MKELRKYDYSGVSGIIQGQSVVKEKGRSIGVCWPWVQILSQAPVNVDTRITVRFRERICIRVPDGW